MSIVLTNAQIWLAQYDLTGFSNRVALDYQAKPLVDTRFGQTTEVNRAGVKTVEAAFGGFGEETALLGSNVALFNQMGIAGKPASFVAEGNVEGNAAYTFEGLTASWQTFGEHGASMPYSGNAKGGGDTTFALARGALLATNAVRTASGAGGSVTLGAIAATERVYAALHVFAANGTLDVTVQSDADGVFPGGASTRITFPQATTVSSAWLSLAGPITDTFWRVAWTIGGGSPSFAFAVVVGKG